MGALYALLKDAFSTAWRFHFDIPEPAYWALVLLAGVGFSAASPLEAIAWAGVFALGLQGVLRWHWHRGRGRRAVVLARFSGHGSAQARSVEAQELMLTNLRDNLDPASVSRVHAIPAVIGAAGAERASRVRRRLRAWLFVYGRVSEQDGSWGVFARLLRPVGGVRHLDEHTRDVTPVRRSWGERVELLSPNERVSAVEYPLRAADELQSIIKASSGQAAFFLGDLARARSLLQEALMDVQDSESAAIDALRAWLAEVLLSLEEIEPALELLRQRAAGGGASPELLRMLHQALRSAAAAGIEPVDRACKESVRALREAADHRADPQRDMTLFNLSMTLQGGRSDEERAEAVSLLEGLESSSPFYRRAWYLHRLLGSNAWGQAISAEANGEPELRERWLVIAGRRYRRAIRLRPRIGFLVWLHSRRLLWTVYPPAAILRANLADVHDALGRRWRGRWQWWRCERKRVRLLRRGMRRFSAGQWELAYANFDWAFVGRHDFRDTVALVYRAVAAWQYGDEEEALRSWRLAAARQPFAAITRAAMLRDPAAHPLIRGLPGEEPTDLEEVMAGLGMPAPPPGPLPPMRFGLRMRLFPGHEPTGG
jgi:tetratricopeptide (TPR) repeat protein